MKLRELQLEQDYYVHNTKRGPRRFHNRFRVTRIERVSDDKSFKIVMGVVLDETGTRPISGSFIIKPKDLLRTWEEHVAMQQARQQLGRLNSATNVVLSAQVEKVKKQIMEALRAKLAELGMPLRAGETNYNTYNNVFNISMPHLQALLGFTPPNQEKLKAAEKALAIVSKAYSDGKELTEEEKEDPVIKKILALPPFNTTSTASTATTVSVMNLNDTDIA